MSNRENFAAIVAEGLNDEQRKRFLSGDMTPEAIWEMVIESHVLILDRSMLVRRNDKKLIGKEPFEDLFLPLTKDLNITPAALKLQPWKLLKTNYDLQRASDAIYEPGQPDLIGNNYNMWHSPGIIPLDDAPPTIIIEHIKYLFPNQRERRLFWDFLKWMAQYPDKKIQFAMLIIGHYGVGKSWLSGLFSILFGPDNVLIIEKGETVTAKFNAEMANQQVVFIDELVPDEKLDLARAVAPMITARSLRIEPKGVNAFKVGNRFNVIAISNHENAVKLNRKDRRWMVLRATDDLYAADENNNKTPEAVAYYNRLWSITPKDGSVTDEVRRLWHYLRTRPLNMSGDFDAQSIAPSTGAKDDVADATETDIVSAVHGAYVDKSGPFRFDLMCVQDVRKALVKSDLRNEKAIDADVGAAMVTAGCRRLDVGQLYLPGYRKPRRLWVAHKSLLPKYSKMTKAQLTAAYKAERDGKPVDAPAEIVDAFGAGGDDASPSVH